MGHDAVVGQILGPSRVTAETGRGNRLCGGKPARFDEPTGFSIYTTEGNSEKEKDMDKEFDLTFNGVLDWLTGTIASGIAGLVEEIVFGWAETFIDLFLGREPNLG